MELLERILMTLLPFVAAVASYRLQARLPRGWVLAFAVASALAAAAYLLFLRNTPLQVALFPHPDINILGKWLPLLLAPACAALFRQVLASGRSFGVGLVIGLFLLSFLDVWQSALYPRPEAPERRKDWVTLQGHPCFCGPAAAASLLRLSGVEVSERDMARACASSVDGTAWPDLYHGLALHAGPGRRVRQVQAPDRRSFPVPILITAWLRTSDPELMPYRDNWGWDPGVPHCVVLRRTLDDGHVLVGDPRFGEERWRLDSLDHLWDGWGIVVEPAGPADKSRTSLPSTLDRPETAP